jgi:hypothetical protein
MFFRDWQGEMPVPEEFVAALSDLTPATLLSTLYTQYSRQYCAQRWGDKSPIYTSHLDTLTTIFPSAQVIHIIRDGRDVALSMLKSYRGARFFYVDVGNAASGRRGAARNGWGRTAITKFGTNNWWLSLKKYYRKFVSFWERAMSRRWQNRSECLGSSIIRKVFMPPP